MMVMLGLCQTDNMGLLWLSREAVVARAMGRTSPRSVAVHGGLRMLELDITRLGIILSVARILSPKSGPSWTGQSLLFLQDRDSAQAWRHGMAWPVRPDDLVPCMVIVPILSPPRCNFCT